MPLIKFHNYLQVIGSSLGVLPSFFRGIPSQRPWVCSNEDVFKAFITERRQLPISIQTPHPTPHPNTVVQAVKNPPAMHEMQIRSLGQEDPLAEGMATYFSILAWRIPWTVEPGRLRSLGSQRARHD